MPITSDGPNHRDTLLFLACVLSVFGFACLMWTTDLSGAVLPKWPPMAPSAANGSLSDSAVLGIP